MTEITRGAVGRIYGNFSRLLTGRLVSGAIGLVWLTLATRYLGRVDFGVLILVQTYLLTVGGLVGFSGLHAVVRFGAQSLAESDSGRLTRLVVFASAVELGFAAVACVMAAALAPILGARLKWPPEVIGFMTPMSLYVLSTVCGAPAGYLQLMRRYNLLALQQFVSSAVRLAASVAAILTRSGLHGFLDAMLLSGIVDCLVMWGLAAGVAWRRQWRLDLKRGIFGVPVENPGFWRFAWTANLDFTLSQQAGRVAPLIVGYVLAAGEAGLFAVAQRGASILTQPAQFLGQAAYSEIAHIAARRAPDREIKRVVRQASSLALVAAAPVWLAIVLFSRHAAGMLGGAGFVAAGPTMSWLACSRALALAIPPMHAALSAYGRPDLSAAANFFGFITAVLALPLLLVWMGVVGAGVQAVLQAVLGLSLFAFFLVRVIAQREAASCRDAPTGQQGRPLPTAEAD